MRFRLNFSYLVLTAVLLLVEILIALYVHDDIIRPYVGDVLVVILMYCCLRSFVKIPVFAAAVSVWLFSFLIELLQYLNFIKLLQLEESRLARTIIGHSFSAVDLLMYTIGFGLILIVEKAVSERKNGS